MGLLLPPQQSRQNETLPAQQHVWIYLYAERADSLIGRRQQPPGVQLAHYTREQAVGHAHLGVSGELQPLDVPCSPARQVRRHPILGGCNVLHNVIACRGSTQETQYAKVDALRSQL
jgi:hypothetical protein